jgi:hypothetical protein
MIKSIRNIRIVVILMIPPRCAVMFYTTHVSAIAF